MIVITERAAERAAELLRRRGKGLAVRVRIKTTGCSGMAYVLEYADEIADTDTVVSHPLVTIVIDAKSAPMLADSIMDYVKKGLNEGFEFVNPNEAGRCGCGESFKI